MPGLFCIVQFRVHVFLGVCNMKRLSNPPAMHTASTPLGNNVVNRNNLTCVNSIYKYNLNIHVFTRK